MKERIVFGETGLQVSPVCFGTWQLSPRFWGDLSREDALEAMRAAFDLGVNFFDTADAYGDGHAETVLGTFLHDVPRDDVVICTKVFNHFNPDASRYPDLSPDHIRQRCDLELQRMGIETIDLYLLHMFDPLTPTADITGTLGGLKAEGKIRSYGVSDHNVEQFRSCRKAGAYDAIQPPYSLLAPGIEKDLLPYCQAENVGVMVYSPLHKGLLTGKYLGEETFKDFRAHHADFRGERFKRIAEAVQELKPLADRYDMTISQLVLRATLMHPAIQVAIVGIKTAAHIEEAVGIEGKMLSREDYFAVRKILTVDSGGKTKDATGTAK